MLKRDIKNILLFLTFFNINLSASEIDQVPQFCIDRLKELLNEPTLKIEPFDGKPPYFKKKIEFKYFQSMTIVYILLEKTLMRKLPDHFYLSDSDYPFRVVLTFKNDNIPQINFETIYKEIHQYISQIKKDWVFAAFEEYPDIHQTLKESLNSKEEFYKKWEIKENDNIASDKDYYLIIKKYSSRAKAMIEHNLIDCLLKSFDLDSDYYRTGPSVWSGDTNYSYIIIKKDKIEELMKIIDLQIDKKN